MPVQTFFPIALMATLFGGSILIRNALPGAVDFTFDTHLVSDTFKRQMYARAMQARQYIQRTGELPPDARVLPAWLAAGKPPAVQPKSE
jgi:hypothetical protein